MPLVAAVRATVVVAISILAFLAAVFAVHRYVDRVAGQPTRDLSKMMYVCNITTEALS